MATEPVLDTGFRTEAGTAAEGRLFATTYVDLAQLPTAARFVTSYRKRHGVRTVEPFAALVHGLRASTYKGPARTIRFEPSTDRFHRVDGLFLHRVENGGPHFLGPCDKG